MIGTDVRKYTLIALVSFGLFAPIVKAKEAVVALNVDDELSATLVDAYEAMGSDYRPRTEHFLEDGSPSYINRLILEKSPYLLQHAHNPVNWYPFGEEAFSLAQEQDKPVFLSIGYATCHWCHVMERESFENEAIAEILNDHFVSIKVDREQLPDVDALYMSSVQMITGRGGWPMSNFLDSTGRPYHGGTYFPPETFTNLLKQIVGLWHNEREALTDMATEVSNALSQANTIGVQAREVGEREITRARQLALSIHDDSLGGFSEAPKFPRESLLTFLLNEARLRNDTPSLNAVNFTLQRMAAGGIHDQIAGGFHRYAVDENWLVPHFEKMLYNQGLLARIYAQAFALGGDADHARTSSGILDYVEREMTSPEGLFYSATDADSEGAEGTFFLWTEDSLADALEPDDVRIASALWGVTEGGNFEHKSILYRPESLASVASELDMDVDALAERRDEISKTLLAKRDTRIHPLRDDKIITAWNALMISAFAEVGYTLDKPAYVSTAVKAAEQLWKTVFREDGTLWRTQYEGRTSVDAKQPDYAYLAESFIALYDIDGDEKWLERAQQVTKTMVERFWDDGNGGFFMGESVVSGTKLTIRPKDIHDSSLPSGNAVALRALAKLYRRTGDEFYNDYANQLITAFSDNLLRQTNAFFYMLTGASEHLFEETGTHEYAARGMVRVSGRKMDNDTVAVSVKMRPGWHINSHEPTLDYLIPTTLAGEEENLVTAVEFPEPVSAKLGFERTELSLFEESVTVTAKVDTSQLVGESVRLEMRLQACSDEVCLAPETVSFLVPWVAL